jgi:hypothetical protein
MEDETHQMEEFRWKKIMVNSKECMQPIGFMEEECLHDMMIKEFCEGNDSKFQEYMKPIELIEK